MCVDRDRRTTGGISSVAGSLLSNNQFIDVSEKKKILQDCRKEFVNITSKELKLYKNSKSLFREENVVQQQSQQQTQSQVHLQHLQELHNNNEIIENKLKNEMLRIAKLKRDNQVSSFRHQHQWTQQGVPQPQPPSKSILSSTSSSITTTGNPKWKAMINTAANSNKPIQSIPHLKTTSTSTSTTTTIPLTMDVIQAIENKRKLNEMSHTNSITSHNSMITTTTNDMNVKKLKPSVPPEVPADLAMILKSINQTK